MMKPYNKPYYNLFQSFVFALKGIFYGLKYERNLRIHFAAGALALYFSRYYSLTKAEAVLLLLCVGFVITCELFNTAIEKTVDIEAPAFNPLAKIAKDVAAGAVLVSAVTSGVVGFILFWQPEIIAVIIVDVREKLFMWIMIVLILISWVILPEKKQIVKK